jgi:HlyD family secretion protein
MKPLKIVLLIVLLGVLLCACSGTKSTSNQPTVLPGNVLPVQSAVGKIIAESKVVPSRSAVLSFSSPGVVAEALVDEGQMVKEGQVIARLKGVERARSAVTTAELAVLSSQQAIKKLNDAWEVAKSNAELALAEAKIALEDAQDARKNKNFQRVGSNYLDELQANYVLAQQAVKDAEDIFENVVDRPEDNADRAAALAMLARARINRDRALENLNYALGLPDANEVAKADAKVEIAKARLTDAQRVYDDLKNSPNPDDISLAEESLRNSQDLLKAAQTALADLEMKSPFSGTVVVNQLKTGEFSNPGMNTVTIADLANMQVETTDLTELNIVHIQVGEAVAVSIDALPELELTGTVERIKALGENSQGDIVYTVTIRLDQQDARLLWNMNGTTTFGQ